MIDKGQILGSRADKIKSVDVNNEDFVLEKSIFSNIFEKDIRRVFIYKKTERLAKAIHLVTPAFFGTPSLRNKLDAIAVALVEAAVLPAGAAREAFSRELLALSSVLAIARSGSLLSAMNTNLISHEAHVLLAEIAAYEEPRLFLDDSPTLAEIARQAGREGQPEKNPLRIQKVKGEPLADSKGHVKDISVRREAILGVLRDKGTGYIKDISTAIREVGEKTIQRELQKLVQEGVIKKKGERRWTEYSII